MIIGDLNHINAYELTKMFYNDSGNIIVINTVYYYIYKCKKKK